MLKKNNEDLTILSLNSYRNIAKTELQRLQKQHIEDTYSIEIQAFNGGISYKGKIYVKNSNIAIFEHYGVLPISPSEKACYDDLIEAFLYVIMGAF